MPLQQTFQFEIRFFPENINQSRATIQRSDPTDDEWYAAFTRSRRTHIDPRIDSMEKPLFANVINNKVHFIVR